MIYCEATDTFTCPKCGSKNVYSKPGMLTDLYICKECGFESREFDNGIND